MTDLMNRLQSSDFKSYAALSSVASFSEFPDVKPKTDLEEMNIMSRAQGLGEVVFDERLDDDEFDEIRSEIGQ